MVDSSAVGTAAMAVTVRHPVTEQVVGILSIAGPSARLTEARMHELAPQLLAAGTELGIVGAETPIPTAADAKPEIGRGSVVLRSEQLLSKTRTP